jgi:hypothetical protein
MLTGQVVGNRQCFLVSRILLTPFLALLQVGCGTTILPARLKEALSEANLAAAQTSILEQDRVKIRDAEHLYYYRAFRRVFGPGCPPGMVRWGSDPCIACGFQLQQPTQTFCVVCGEYPARKPAECERGGDEGGGDKKGQGDMKNTNDVGSEEGCGESGVQGRGNGEGGTVGTGGVEEGLEKSGHKERGKSGIGKVATEGTKGLETEGQTKAPPSRTSSADSTDDYADASETLDESGDG